MGITQRELEERIARALVDSFHRRVPRTLDETDVQMAARLAGVHVGHVRAFLRDREFFVSGGDDEISWTQDQLDDLEAQLSLAIVEPANLSTQHFNVNAGDGSQVQVGNAVSGSQNMAITYAQVVEQLKEAIQRSSMPEPEKKSVLAKLGEALSHPVVVDLLKVLVKLGGGG